MTEYTKPLPNVAEKFTEYWAGCKQHKLLIQKCKNCGTYRWYPRPMCRECYSMDTEWVAVRGRGKVYSYSIVYHPPIAAFKDDVPFTLVVVQLDDLPHVRMMGNIVDYPPEKVKIGMPVEVVFDDVTKEVTLPRWRPAS